MSVDVESFRARYPDITEELVSDVFLLSELEFSQCQVSRGRFSTTDCGQGIYERAIFALTAHTVMVDATALRLGSEAKVGAVSAKSVGKVSTNYAGGTTSGSVSDLYNKTIYGQEYLSLLSRFCVTVMSV